MKKEELEKYIGELSPELQAKARECKDMTELNALLADNDVELSEDALEAVAGGCSASSDIYNQGDPVMGYRCPDCNSQLYYWDMCANEKGALYITRLYCNNSGCSSCGNGLWYVRSCRTGEPVDNNSWINRY